MEATKITRLKDFTSNVISVTEASKMSGFTPDFIRKLIRRGEVEGVKVGKSWLTTREAIREYLKKERRPGPRPQYRGKRKRR